jgi:hypothetical protein
MRLLEPGEPSRVRRWTGSASRLRGPARAAGGSRTPSPPSVSVVTGGGASFGDEGRNPAQSGLLVGERLCDRARVRGAPAVHDSQHAVVS